MNTTKMPVSDVWLTPPRMATPRLWKISSGIVLTVVAACSKILLGLLNKTNVDNLQTLHDVIDNRPENKPLITASNHYSCIDDLLLARRVIPVVRGEGVYQHTMNFLKDELNTGGWVHVFPEGKVNMTKEFMRLKWGIGRLIADSEVCPVVLPYWHNGMDSVLPNTKPYIPQIGKKITVTIGEPMNFENDLARLRGDQKSDIEIRKFITDKIQDEFGRLKAITERRHTS